MRETLIILGALVLLGICAALAHTSAEIVAEAGFKIEAKR